MHLTSSTKDWKKGCAYDPGALNKQGALQNQTLRYIDATVVMDMRMSIHAGHKQHYGPRFV